MSCTRRKEFSRRDAISKVAAIIKVGTLIAFNLSHDSVSSQLRAAPNSLAASAGVIGTLCGGILSI